MLQRCPQSTGSTSGVRSWGNYGGAQSPQAAAHDSAPVHPYNLLHGTLG